MAADRIKEITVEIDDDATGLSKTLSGVNKETFSLIITLSYLWKNVYNSVIKSF